MPSPTQLVLFQDLVQEVKESFQPKSKHKSKEKQNNITFQFFDLHVDFVSKYLRQFLPQIADLEDIARTIVTDIYHENRQLKQIQLSLLKKIIKRKKHYWEHYFFETSLES